MGFQFVEDGAVNPNDELFVFGSKANLSGSRVVNRLQDAVNDSAKDRLREARTLNALKQRYLERKDDKAAQKIERFQDEADRPFKRISGAAAVLNDNLLDENLIEGTTAAEHFNARNLKLIVVTGASKCSSTHWERLRARVTRSNPVKAGQVLARGV